MGMTRAKSLLEVKEGLTFLDVIAAQVLELRRAHGTRLPLVLMNSFYTREESLAALRRHEGVQADVALDFVQNKEPKVLAEDLMPVELAPRPEPGVVPAGARRPVHGPGHERHARKPAAAGLRVRVRVELRQPRRRARSAHPVLVRGRGDPVPDGGDRPDRGGPQGRPPGGAASGRAPGAARDRPDPRAPIWTPSRTSPATASSTPTPFGSGCGRWPRCSPNATTCSGCR